MKKKGIIQEFKEFISRGNVIDLAVGVIIGSAFTSIVNSLVNDIVMPILSIILGRINLDGLKYVIAPAGENTDETVLAYGSFLQSIVNFLIIAFVIFLVVKAINTLREKVDAAAKKNEQEKPAEEPKLSDEAALLTEIRDMLKNGKND